MYGPPSFIERFRFIKRPKNTCFSQQEYAAVRLRQDPLSLLPFSVAWLILSIALTSALFKLNKDQYSFSLDYTSCRSISNQNKFCYDKSYLANDICKCQIEIDIEDVVPLPLFISYGLYGMYQNNRGYYESYDPLQLNGNLPEQPSLDCGEFHNISGVPIIPCGMMANAIFNDTFEFTLSSPFQLNIELSFPPILKSDSKKFKNPPLDPGQTLAQKLINFTKPSSWPVGLAYLYPSDQNFNGVKYPPFINWMAISPFKSFVKPLFVLSSPDETRVMPKGKHHITITYNYPTKQSSTRKFVLVTTASFFGPKNLPLCYSALLSCVVTSIMVLLGLFQLVGGIVNNF